MSGITFEWRLRFKELDVVERMVIMLLFGIIFVTIPLMVAMCFAIKYIIRIVEEVIEWIRFS